MKKAVRKNKQALPALYLCVEPNVLVLEGKLMQENKNNKTESKGRRNRGTVAFANDGRKQGRKSESCVRKRKNVG